MKRKTKAPPTKAPKNKGRFGPAPKAKPRKPQRKETRMSNKPKNHDHDYDKEPEGAIAGLDQGDSGPGPYTTEQASPLVEPPPDHDADRRERHPIEAALTQADEAIRKSQGGPEGSGIKALLAIVAAQMGVKIA